MQTIRSTTRAHGGAEHANALSRVLSALRGGLDRFVEAQARTNEIARLRAMSDEDLARLGLRRDRIVQHVFRNRLNL